MGGSRSGAHAAIIKSMLNSCSLATQIFCCDNSIICISPKEGKTLSLSLRKFQSRICTWWRVDVHGHYQQGDVWSGAGGQSSAHVLSSPRPAPNTAAHRAGYNPATSAGLMWPGIAGRGFNRPQMRKHPGKKLHSLHNVSLSLPVKSSRCT